MDLSGINGIVKREMIKYWRAKSRIFVNMLMPIMFMLIIGPAFGSMFAGEGAAISVDYTGIENFFHFMAPGIVAMSLLMGSIFNAGMPILFDKMMGFSDVITASPIKRGNIVFGFVLAGSLKALIQGGILLGIALVMGVPLTGFIALSIFGVIMIMIIGTLALSSIGLLVASKTMMQNFMIVVTLIQMPIMFLSGIFVPMPSLGPAIIVCFFN